MYDYPEVGCSFWALFTVLPDSPGVGDVTGQSLCETTKCALGGPER